MDESDLLRSLKAATQGDREAMDRIIAAYGTWIRSRVRRRLGAKLRQRVETEDVVQSSLALAVRDLQGHDVAFEGEKPFLAWLLKITERKIAMAGRHHAARKRDVERQVAFEAPDARALSQTSPSQAAGRSERAERIRASMASLPALERQIIEMRVLEGLAFAEIATRLEQPSEASVRQRYVRALAKAGPLIREALGESSGSP